MLQSSCLIYSCCFLGAGAIDNRDIGNCFEFASKVGTLGSVTGLAYSPDGKKLVAGYFFGSVCVWDPSSGRLVKHFQAHPKSVTSVATSRDGRTFATGHHDGTVCLWNSVTFERLQVLRAHTSDISGLSFSPNSSNLASADGTECAIIWEIRSGKLLQKLEHECGLRGIEFSADGRTIVSESRDSVLRRWDVATGRRLFLLHAGGRRSLPLTGRDAYVTITKIEDRGPTSEIAFHNICGDGFVTNAMLKGAVFSAVVSRDERILAVVSLVGANVTVTLFETATGSEIKHHALGIAGPPLESAFSPDTRFLAVEVEDKIAIWKVWSSGIAAGKPKSDKDVIASISGSDASKAHAAVCHLLSNPARAVALLRRQLTETQSPAPASAVAMMKNLSDDSFEVREKSFLGLGEAGVSVDPLLRRRLSDADCSLDEKQQIKNLLARLKPGKLLIVRALSTLELLGTPEAVALIKSLSSGDSESFLVQSAQSTYRRVSGNSK